MEQGIVPSELEIRVLELGIECSEAGRQPGGFPASAVSDQLRLRYSPGRE